MKRFSKTTAVYLSIRSKIENGELPNQAKLPSLLNLSKMYGVALLTAKAGIDRLAQDGFVTKRRGSGIYVKSQIEEQEPTKMNLVPAKSKAEAVADQIAGDIASGHIRVGDFLPLQKVLLFRYRTSKPTITQAVKLLIRRQLIHQRGTHFMVGHAMEKQGFWLGSTKTLPKVLVIGSREEVRTSLGSRLEEEFLASFRNELTRWGQHHFEYIPLGPVVGDDPRETIRTRFSESLRPFPAKDVAGILFRRQPVIARKVGLQDVLGAQLEPLVKIGCPVVWYCYAFPGETVRAVLRKAGKKTQAVFLNDFSAGEKVGTYLALLGHRRVAYFNFVSPASWTLERRAGFDRGFSAVLGRGGQVVYYNRSFEQSQFYKMQPSIDAVRQGIDTMLCKAKGITRPTHFNLNARIHHMMSRQVVRVAICAKEMKPLFAKALSQKETSAWACADPHVALAARIFLQRRKIRVPQQISLVCIDDDEDTMLLELDAYNFQIEQMGYLAAHILLGDVPVAKDRYRIVRCSGRVVARGSVQKPAESKSTNLARAKQFA